MRQFIIAICIALVAGCSFGVTFAPKEYVDNLLDTTLPLYLRNDKANNEVQIFGGYLSGFGFHADTGYNDNGWLQYTAHNGNLLAQSLPDYIASNPWGFLTTLAKATNYTDAALGAFAATGAVFRAATYGTPTRWTDETGCVWEVVRSDDWSAVNTGLPAGEDVEWYGPSWVTETDGDYYPSVGWYIASNNRTPELIGSDLNATTLWLDWIFWRETEMFEVHTVFSRQILTNLVGRVALTNDIPDVSGYATPADVTAAIREKSLCGIWDDKLGVWWTPHMSGGAYYWTATTNVNLSAEGNQ